MVFWIIMGVAAILIIFGVYNLQQNKTKKDAALIALKNIPDFNTDVSILKIGRSGTGLKGIAFDNQKKKFALLQTNGSYTVYDFKALIGSEIIIDGKTTTKTNRSSQLAGAVVGGVILGGVGAAVGAMTGSKREEKKIKSVKVKILVDDLTNPSYLIDFIEDTSTGSTFPAVASAEAEKLNDILKVILR